MCLGRLAVSFVSGLSGTVNTCDAKRHSRFLGQAERSFFTLISVNKRQMRGHDWVRTAVELLVCKTHSPHV